MLGSIPPADLWDVFIIYRDFRAFEGGFCCCLASFMQREIQCKIHVRNSKRRQSMLYSNAYRCIHAIYLPWIDKIRPSQSSFLNCMQTSLPAAGLPLMISLLKEICSTSSFCRTSSPLFTQLTTACVSFVLFEDAISLSEKEGVPAVLKMHIQIWSIHVINILENWRSSHLNEDCSQWKTFY